MREMVDAGSGDRSTASPQRQIRPDDWFIDVSPQTGIEFTYNTGREGQSYTILETIGGGVGIFDFDNDEKPDLFLPGGGTIAGDPIKIAGLPTGFFRNRGEWHFQDVARESLIRESQSYTLACSACDFNCDGCSDLFVTGIPGSSLFCNQGDGTFREVSSSAGLKMDSLQAACAWGDFDADGLPDLYVTGYVRFNPQKVRICTHGLQQIREPCGPWKYPPASDRLFQNAGDGTFVEITNSVGLRKDGKGLGAIWSDFNADGNLDLYVANDTTANFLYLGDGRGQFVESGLVSGTAYDENGAPQGSMGLGFGDYDGDGLGDLFVTSYELEDNTLYHNLGNSQFEVATSRVGLQNVCRPYVGFGTGWVDWDSDGWLDLYVLNGHVLYHTVQSPYLQPPFVFRNVEGQRFENLSHRAGPYFETAHAGRGGAVGDLDNDGAPDLVAVHQNSPVTLLKNQLTPREWLSVCLHGTKSDPFAVGAVVTIEFAGRRLSRHVCGGEGYFSQSDRRILLPAKGVGPRECTVNWLSGTRETFRNLCLRRTNHLIEGQGDRS